MSSLKEHIPRLSVVVPNFNHANHLGRCINGLKAQRYSDFEAIIIDDCSTDKSVDEIERLINDDSRFRLIRYSSNLGVIKSLNLGLKKSRDEFIYFGAADDETTPNLFWDLMKLLDSDSKLSLASMMCKVKKGSDAAKFQTRPMFPPSRVVKIFSPQEFERMMRLIDNWIITGASIIRRKTSQDYNGLDENLEAMADGILLRQIAFSSFTAFVPRYGLIWNRSEHGYSVSTLTNEERFKKVLKSARDYLSVGSHFPVWYWNLFASRMKLAKEVNDFRIHTTLLIAEFEKDRRIIKLVKILPLFRRIMKSLLIERPFSLPRVISSTLLRITVNSTPTNRKLSLASSTLKS